MVAKAVDDTEEEDYQVLVGTQQTITTTKSVDPFETKIDELRAYSGISTALKKNMTRRLNKAFQSEDGTAESKKVELPDNLTGYNVFGVVLPPFNLDYLAQLFEKSSPHAAAVRAKVSNIVGLGYDFVESPAAKLKLEDEALAADKAVKMRSKMTRLKIAMNQWLDDCNKEDTFTETLIKVWTDYETTGNGYLEIGRTPTGEVKYLGHIPSTSMRIRKNRDGFVQIIDKNVVFFRNFGETTPDPFGNDPRPNEVIHFKKYSPTNGYYGIPDIISAMTAIAGNEFAARYNLDYFENKTVPRYVVIVKGGKLSNNSKREILNFFDASLRGQHHRTLFVPLPADSNDAKVSFEMKPVEAGTQDASFVNYTKINLNSILMAHRVPISKVGLAEGVSLAVARDADKTFKEQVCNPEQRIAEKKLNKIISKKTDVFMLKLNELTLTDEDTQSKIDERYLRMQTIVPNEVRQRKGMSGLKGGDKVVDLKPQQAAETKTQATGNRQRDQQRQANSTDSASSTNTRAPQGEGRQTG